MKRSTSKLLTTAGFAALALFSRGGTKSANAQGFTKVSTPFTYSANDRYGVNNLGLGVDINTQTGAGLTSNLQGFQTAVGSTFDGIGFENLYASRPNGYNVTNILTNVTTAYLPSSFVYKGPTYFGVQGIQNGKVGIADSAGQVFSAFPGGPNGPGVTNYFQGGAAVGYIANDRVGLWNTLVWNNQSLSTNLFSDPTSMVFAANTKIELVRSQGITYEVSFGGNPGIMALPNLPGVEYLNVADNLVVGKDATGVFSRNLSGATAYLPGAEDLLAVSLNGGVFIGTKDTAGTFSIWGINGVSTADPLTGPPTTPEPGPVAFGAGLVVAGAGLLARRRKQQNAKRLSAGGPAPAP